MSQEPILKVGYYSIYEILTTRGKKYKVDSGKTIYLQRFKKYIINPYRDEKEFTSLDKAKDYIKNKLSKLIRVNAE